MQTPRPGSAGLLLVTILMAMPAPVAHAEVVIGGEVTGIPVYDLEDLAEFAGPLGSAFSIIENEELGVTFGERFFGQVNTPVEGFDFITGIPTAPLTMDDTVDAAFGVNVLAIFGTTIVDGIGPLGFPNPWAIADGAISILYERDQQVIAFDIVGTNSGTITVQFFNRSAMPIGVHVVSDIMDTTYVFTSEGDDIAGITIDNTDWGGVGFDNFRFLPPDEESQTSDPPVCDAGGPYFAESTGVLTTISLDASGSSDPSGAGLSYEWSTDCPAAFFDEAAAETTVLTLDASQECQVECSVTLSVANEYEMVDCETTVTVVDTIAPELSVDQTPIEVIDQFCDGFVEVALPEAGAEDDGGGAPAISIDAPDMFASGETTVVTYTADDGCGHASSATLEVTVRYGANVVVLVLAAPDASQGNAGALPVAGAVVGAFPVGPGTCASDWINGGTADGTTLESVVANCTATSSAISDADGMTAVDVAPGKYIVIAGVDFDVDGEPDAYAAQPTGQINCGKEKHRTIVVSQPDPID